MKKYEVEARTPQLVAALLDIWEDSVRATHLLIHNYGIKEVTVNEQNPQAVGFYRYLGFETYKRTDYDEERNPYPLLYMKLV